MAGEAAAAAAGRATEDIKAERLETAAKRGNGKLRSPPSNWLM